MTAGPALTHSLQPILPQNPKMPLPPLAKWVPKPIQRQRAPKLRRDPEGGQLGILHLSRSAEAGFLALTHLSPGAHAGTSAGHR